MANRRFIDFPIAASVGNNDIVLIWQDGLNKQTTKATLFAGSPSTLASLTDVDISALTNGQILQYNSTTSKWENVDRTDIDLDQLGDVTIVSPTNGQVLVYNSSTSKWENSSGGFVPYTGAVTTVNLGAQTIQAGSFVKAGGTAAQFLKANGSVDSTAYGTGSVTSVALTMPSAFSVANSPITTAGTLAVTGAGTVAQYVRGDGSLADFPESSGGGSSVSYYLNGSVSQGTIGGVAYLEMNKVPILGAGTDFTRNSNGYIASFITDAGDPNLLEIPAGNWNFESYFSASSGGGSPTFYVELYKVNSGGTATLIASNSANPELISFGTTIAPYFSSLAVPTTVLALTDRLAVRYYVTPEGRTITLHTEGPHLCQIITTFTTGLTALNGLTAQVQNFAVGTTGTDFNIASSTATHTFNLPTASGTNRGALSSTDWTTFNNKENAITAGTTAQYYRGDKTFQTLNTSVVPELTNLYYTEARVNANANVAANTAARHNAVTLGTANGLSLSTQQLSLQLASGSQNGALSSTDWTTFNNKENAITAGTTAQYFRGDKTFQTLNTAAVPESGNLYFTNARAIASVLTGYTSGAGTISASDSILSAIQKLNGNIGALVTGVSSVNGQTGAVTLTTTNIAEGTNLYYTEARVNANANVSANTAARHAAVTLGTANGLSLSTQQLSLGLASAGVTGALSGTDWSTFNSKQQALNGTGFVKISGTTISYDNSTYLTTAAAASTYLPLAGGTMTGNINWTANDVGLTWSRNTDGASIKFISVGDGTGESYLQIGTSDNGNEAIVFTQTSLIRVQIDTDGLLKNGSSQKYVFENGGTWGIGITGNAGTVTNGVYTSRTITINGTTQDLSANRTYNVGTVTSVAALTLGTSGTDLSSSVANSTTTPVITLNVPTASASNRGALSAADWITFNNKQNALTNPVTGTGTTNYLPKFTGASTIGDSSISDVASSPLSIVKNASSSTSNLIFISPTTGTNASILNLDNAGAGSFYIGRQNSAGNSVLLSGLGAYASVIGHTGSQTLHLVTNALSRVQIDGSGNLGLGVTPSAWNSAYKAFQFGTTGALFGESGDAANYFTTNTFVDSVGFKYITSDWALGYFQENGVHSWRTATSGTAGNAISFTQAMTLTSGGNLILTTGTVSDNGARLQVSGGGIVLTNYNTTNANGSANVYQQSGSTIGWIGNGSTSVVGGSTNDFGINSQSKLFLAVGGFERMSIASTGAATFSSSVTALGAINVGSAGSLQINAGSAATPLLTQSTNYTELYRRSGGVGIYLGGTGDPANYYDNTSHFFRSSAGGSTYLIINSSGNLGLGVTPSAWRNGWKTMQIANAGISSDGAQTFFGYNVYLASDDFRYINSDNSTIYRQVSGQHIWATAPSGTAGNAITFTQAMTLGSNSGLSIGTPSAAPSQGLLVQGNVGIGGSPSFKLDVNSLGYGIQHYGNGSNYLRTYAGSSYQVIESNGTNQFGYFNGNFFVQTSSTDRLTIASTGAATFSSSVTATSFIPSGSTIPTNGMYLPSANTIAFSTNTTERISVSSAGELQLKQSSNSAQNSVIFNTTIQNAMTLNSSGFLILNGTTGSSRITCYGDGYFSGGIQTGNPYGTTAANWLLGRFLTETTSANGSIRVQIGSKYYNIAAEDLGTVPT